MKLKRALYKSIPYLIFIGLIFGITMCTYCTTKKHSKQAVIYYGK